MLTDVNRLGYLMVWTTDVAFCIKRENRGGIEIEDMRKLIRINYYKLAKMVKWSHIMCKITRDIQTSNTHKIKLPSLDEIDAFPNTLSYKDRALYYGQNLMVITRIFKIEEGTSWADNICYDIDHFISESFSEDYPGFCKGIKRLKELIEEIEKNYR